MKFFTVLKNIVFRGFLLYLVIFVVMSVLIDKTKVRFKIVNELRVPLDALIFLPDKKIAITPATLQDQLAFYQKVREIFPRDDAIPAIMGFCYYHLTQTEKAATAFEQAKKLNPYFFWHPYNLGLIFYQSGNYPKAIEYFQAALAQDPVVAKEIIVNSRIYRNLDQPGIDTDGYPEFRNDDFLETILAHLAQARTNSYKLLILSFEHEKNYAAMVRVANLAIQTKIDKPEIFYEYLGIGALYLQQLPTAVTAFQQSIRLDPQRPNSYRYLARCFKELNNTYLSESFAQQAEILKKNSIADVTPADLELRIF